MIRAMDEPDASEREYRERLEAHARKAVEYFSDRNKPQRERAVCRAFLRCLGVAFDEAEIVAQPLDDSVDVVFRDARFQVRDHRAPDAQPHGEWRARLARATQAQTMDDAIAPWPRVPEWNGTTPISRSEMTAATTDALESKARKYGKGCGTLDALVYADLTWTRALRLDTEPGDTTRLGAQGWRSVSVLFPMLGLVLCARAEAPRFLRDVAGTALYRWPDPDTLFDP
jgi:hypothetical protein